LIWYQQGFELRALLLWYQQGFELRALLLWYQQRFELRAPLSGYSIICGMDNRPVSGTVPQRHSLTPPQH
jgi:hypothetical protein